MHPEVRLALAWLEENYGSASALEEFRARRSMSRDHFRILFRRHLGCSVGAHLNRLRMQEAMNLLKQSALPIKAIAIEVGFSDPPYFSRRFQKFWDISPSEVRR